MWQEDLPAPAELVLTECTIGTLQIRRSKEFTPLHWEDLKQQVNALSIASC